MREGRNSQKLNGMWFNMELQQRVLRVCGCLLLCNTLQPLQSPPFFCVSKAALAELHKKIAYWWFVGEMLTSGGNPKTACWLGHPQRPDWADSQKFKEHICLTLFADVCCSQKHGVCQPHQSDQAHTASAELLAKASLGPSKPVLQKSVACFL